MPPATPPAPAQPAEARGEVNPAEYLKRIRETAKTISTANAAHRVAWILQHLDQAERLIRQNDRERDAEIARLRGEREEALQILRDTYALDGMGLVAAAREVWSLVTRMGHAARAAEADLAAAREKASAEYDRGYGDGLGDAILPNGMTLDEADKALAAAREERERDDRVLVAVDDCEAPGGDGSNKCGLHACCTACEDRLVELMAVARARLAGEKGEAHGE